MKTQHLTKLLQELTSHLISFSPLLSNRFIFKGDADVYVNVENILEMLHGQKPDKDLFVGDIIVNAKPIRRRSSKYYVPEYMYGVGLYPNYAGGGGFVMSGHTALRLSSACEQVTTGALQLVPPVQNQSQQRCCFPPPGGIVPHRWRLLGNVPPADWRQAVTAPRLQDIRDLPALSGPQPPDLRPLLLPRTHGGPQPQRPSDLAHVEPAARPQTELPQQNQADFLAVPVEGGASCYGHGGDGLRREAGLCPTLVTLSWVESTRFWGSRFCVQTEGFVMCSGPRLRRRRRRFDLLGKWVGIGWNVDRAHLCVGTRCLKKKNSHTATFNSIKGLRFRLDSKASSRMETRIPGCWLNKQRLAPQTLWAGADRVRLSQRRLVSPG